ncbi:MAG: ATP-binding protein [Gammaproteobacteria bacterium]
MLLTLSILLPGFVAGALAVRLVYDEQQEVQKTGLKEAARAFSLLVDTELKITEGKLVSLASSPDLQAGDLDSFARHARRVAPPPDSVVVLSDLDGQQLLNTRAPVGQPLPRINARLLAMRRAASPEAVVVSDLFVAAIRKGYDFAVDVPVQVDGVVKYRLSMGLPVATLQAMFRQQAFPEQWLATVVDRTGTVVARSMAPEKYVGKRATDSLLQRVLAGERAGINYGTTLDGRQVAAFFSRAPNSNWTVVLAIPIDEIQRPAFHAALLMGAALLIVLAVALAIASTYAKRTVTPIERLRRAAERLGQGELVEPETTGLVETDKVFEAMAGASRDIQDSKADLQQRVSEAVAVSERAQHALLQGQKLEALGRLTGGIAHDFNNILQTLSTALELIKRSQQPAQIHQLAATCSKAIERATALTGQMRAFGRVQDVRLEALDLAEALGTVLPLLTSSLPSNIDFEMNAQPGLWPVFVDRLQLELALLNLVINARDAMPGGGRIHLRIANEHGAAPPGLARGDYVHVSLRDNGAGMPAEVLAHALDPFFTTKPVDQGSGLGLPQAYGFATQSHGTLVLSSVEGEGTTVDMYLPRTGRAISAAAHPEVAPGRGSGRMLYVEDDLLVREAIVPALEHAGFKVTAAASGDEALRLLHGPGASFDILFTDVVMPGHLDGVALARLVRQRYPAMRVLLATGHSYLHIDLPGVLMVGKPYELGSVIRMLDGAAAA